MLEAVLGGGGAGLLVGFLLARAIYASKVKAARAERDLAEAELTTRTGQLQRADVETGRLRIALNARSQGEADAIKKAIEGMDGAALARDMADLLGGGVRELPKATAADRDREGTALPGKPPAK